MFTSHSVKSINPHPSCKIKYTQSTNMFTRALPPVLPHPADVSVKPSSTQPLLQVEGWGHTPRLRHIEHKTHNRVDRSRCLHQIERQESEHLQWEWRTRLPSPTPLLLPCGRAAADLQGRGRRNQGISKRTWWWILCDGQSEAAQPLGRWKGTGHKTERQQSQYLLSSILVDNESMK